MSNITESAFADHIRHVVQLAKKDTQAHEQCSRQEGRAGFLRGEDGGMVKTKYAGQNLQDRDGLRKQTCDLTVT